MRNIPDYRLEPPESIECPPCPVCGSLLYDYVCVDVSGDVVGCSECVKTKDPWEYLEILEDDDDW